MSSTASVNFRTEFDAMVKQAFQAGSKLSGKVRTRTGVNAKTHKFPKMGKGVAPARVPQSDVTPMGIVHTVATATLTDWNAPEYSDILDLDKLAFDEKKELMMASIMAMGRRYDQLIIDAMASSASSTQIDVNVGGSNTGLNVDKIRRAKRLMDAAGVPNEGRVIVHTALALEDALGETEIGSSDFNVTKALAMGELKTYAGFEFVLIEDRANEGGLPLATTNQRNNFAFHRDAVGLAIATEMKSAVDWIPEKTSWLINTVFSAGAVTIDTDGVYDLITYEA